MRCGSMGNERAGVCTQYFGAMRLTSPAKIFWFSQVPKCSMTLLENTKSNDWFTKGTANTFALTVVNRGLFAGCGNRLISTTGKWPGWPTHDEGSPPRSSNLVRSSGFSREKNKDIRFRRNSGEILPKM